MASPWLTWSGLGVEPQERTALRRAGIAPGDLLARSAGDLVGATDGAITPARAEEYVRRATLLAITTPARVARIERLGVRDRDELAGSDPVELFRRWQEVSPYTGPVAYDGLAAAIALARGDTSERATAAWWTRERARTGLDPVRLAWLHRYGRHTDPYPTGRRLRLPAAGVNARIRVGDGDERGWPVPPLTDGVTVTHHRTGVMVGHWMWAGRRAAFFRLEEAPPGAPVEVSGGRTAVERYEVTEVVRGEAPLALAPPRDGLLLVTPPHLRWAPRLRGWPLTGDPETTWVQVAALAAPA